MLYYLCLSAGLTLIEALDFLSFLQLESKARLVLTDSGGVQEETCVLGVPCVTLRDNMERTETLDVGSNMLAGTQSERILEAAKTIADKQRSWANPFWHNHDFASLSVRLVPFLLPFGSGAPANPHRLIVESLRFVKRALSVFRHILLVTLARRAILKKTNWAVRTYVPVTGGVHAALWKPLYVVLRVFP